MVKNGIKFAHAKKHRKWSRHQIVVKTKVVVKTTNGTLH
jgi:hypothetical protein